MEKFKPLFYIEKSFKSFCFSNGLSNFGICNDMVITVIGKSEFSSEFLEKLSSLVRTWNNMSLYADKHIFFKYGISGIWSGQVIEPYLRLWFECDGIVFFSKDCKL